MFTMRILAAGAAIFALGAAGCTSAGAGSATPSPPADCGAAALQDRIGQPVTGTTAADLRIGGEPVASRGTVRVVGPGQAMTMDYREDRLTIETDADGNLATARCV